MNVDQETQLVKVNNKYMLEKSRTETFSHTFKMLKVFLI